MTQNHRRNSFLASELSYGISFVSYSRFSAFYLRKTGPKINIVKDYYFSKFKIKLTHIITIAFCKDPNSSFHTAIGASFAIDPRALVDLEIDMSMSKHLNREIKFNIIYRFYPAD
jgi:hypothetical protein